MARSPTRDLQVLRRYFIGQRRNALWLGAVLAVVTSLAGIGLLGLSGWFITATALAGLQLATALVFDVFMPSAGIRLLALGRTGARYAERLVTHDATLGVLAGLRERLLRGWARPEAAQRLLLRPARLLQRLTADIDALDSLYLRIAVPLGVSLGAAAMAGLLAGLHDARLGLALAAWLLLGGWGSAWVIARRARPVAVRRALALERLRARAADLVAGQTELAMAGRLRAQCDALAVADARLTQADLHMAGLEARASFVHGLMQTTTLVGVLLAAAWLVEQRRIGVPAAALLLLTALAATESLAALRRGALEAGRTWLAVRRLAPAVAGVAATASAPSNEPPRVGAAALVGDDIQLDGAVVRREGSARPALQLPWLHIGAGERVAVIGPSGAGKSTLLALVAGELAPAAGSVRAPRATWMTQRPELFRDSLRDNLKLAAPQATDAQLSAALADAGMQADVARLRQGLDTPLGEGGLGLSGGQMRRLSLARLLLQNAPLWLLDEPTEALDAATAREVLARLDARAQGHTLLIATHMRREAQLADRLLCIEAGELRADLRRGTPAFDTALAALRDD
ncbi:ATP-binding cassette domain-containing protein [uncultured Pseudacidovorax sp.]|uniref:amino acid ABC transporter ATP-binding/permease protein n=1 Tax=uncultured Pseudacidovorax sp. TaxID=679313 RepID=UPI0025CFF397|nr:ATP-binding cassette domain-containing protein [uncultured Pseudacidovorax sp.]